MTKAEKISLEKLKNMAYDINCIGAEYCKIDEEDMTCNKCLRCAYDTITNYIDKIQKELKDGINARFELQRRIDKIQKENCEQKADMNKLINYIAVRENKTHEEICKEFNI